MINIQIEFSLQFQNLFFLRQGLLIPINPEAMAGIVVKNPCEMHIVPYPSYIPFQYLLEKRYGNGICPQFCSFLFGFFFRYPHIFKFYCHVFTVVQEYSGERSNTLLSSTLFRKSGLQKTHFLWHWVKQVISFFIFCLNTPRRKRVYFSIILFDFGLGYPYSGLFFLCVEARSLKNSCVGTAPKLSGEKATLECQNRRTHFLTQTDNFMKRLINKPREGNDTKWYGPYTRSKTTFLMAQQQFRPPQCSDKWIAVRKRKRPETPLPVAEECTTISVAFWIVILGQEHNRIPSIKLSQPKQEICHWKSFSNVGPHFTKLNNIRGYTKPIQAAFDFPFKLFSSWKHSRHFRLHCKTVGTFWCVAR